MLEAVLVLNANYEPIHVCNMRRAIGLIVTDKATMVSDGRGDIRTINNTFPCPSIIRLQKMVHRPRPQIKLTRREIFRRDNYTCQYCGKHTLDLTIDHVIPRHMNGPHNWQNVVTACSACNHRKGGRTLEETHMRLFHIPKEPPNNAYYIFSRNLPTYTDWEPYLVGW
jgi:5-methylcytosine-specific restriction endonuclease McrA